MLAGRKKGDEPTDEPDPSFIEHNVTWKLDAAGILVEYTGSGNDYMKAPVDERFTLKDGKAIWKNRTEDGNRSIATPAFYVPTNAPPEIYGVLARALLKAPNRTLALLPAGEAHLEVAGTATVGGKALDEYLISGLGFTPQPIWLDRDGNTHTDKLRLTERYRRPNFGSLEVEVTFADPGAYTRPWTVKVSAQFAADTEMLEWVCNEGAGRSLTHWVGTAADDRKNEVKVDPQILSRYVGTYVEQPPFWRGVQIVGQDVPSGRTVVITVENGKLIGNMDGRGPQVLIGMSDKEFTGLYGLGVEFIDDGKGGLYVKHVSGNYRFARK